MMMMIEEASWLTNEFGGGVTRALGLGRRKLDLRVLLAADFHDATRERLRQ